MGRGSGGKAVGWNGMRVKESTFRSSGSRGNSDAWVGSAKQKKEGIIASVTRPSLFSAPTLPSVRSIELPRLKLWLGYASEMRSANYVLAARGLPLRLSMGKGHKLEHTRA